MDSLQGLGANQENYYETLGCDPSSTEDQILAEYRAKGPNLMNLS